MIATARREIYNSGLGQVVRKHIFGQQIFTAEEDARRRETASDDLVTRMSQRLAELAAEAKCHPAGSCIVDIGDGKLLSVSQQFDSSPHKLSATIFRKGIFDPAWKSTFAVDVTFNTYSSPGSTRTRNYTDIGLFNGGEITTGQAEDLLDRLPLSETPWGGNFVSFSRQPGPPVFDLTG